MIESSSVYDRHNGLRVIWEFEMTAPAIPFLGRTCGRYSFSFDSNHHTRDEAIEETAVWAARAFASLGINVGMGGPVPGSLCVGMVLSRAEALAFDEVNERIADRIWRRTVSGCVAALILAGLYWLGTLDAGGPFVRLGRRDDSLVRRVAPDDWAGRAA